MINPSMINPNQSIKSSIQFISIHKELARSLLEGDQGQSHDTAIYSSYSKTESSDRINKKIHSVRSSNRFKSCRVTQSGVFLTTFRGSSHCFLDSAQGEWTFRATKNQLPPATTKLNEQEAHALFWNNRLT